MDSSVERMIDFVSNSKRLVYDKDSRIQDQEDIVEGDLTYAARYLGGDSFAGTERIIKNGCLTWQMNYIGRVLRPEYSADFLKECLSLVPRDYPFRGPNHHVSGDYSYERPINGDFNWFAGLEFIYCKGVLVYEGRFHGGLIK